MVTGFLLSGYIISKYKPGPRKLFFWNVIVGFGYMIGQVIYIFLSCDNNYINNFTGTLNLTMQCNTNCSCSGVAYSPVCYEPTSTTFFSPCHAGCNRWDDNGKFYDNCACAAENKLTRIPLNSSSSLMYPEVMKSSSYSTEFTSSGILSTTLPVISTTEFVPVSIVLTETSEITENVTTEDQYEPLLFKSIINTTEDSPSDASDDEVSEIKLIDPTEIDTQEDDQVTQDDDATTSNYNDENDYNITDEKVISRQERSSTDEDSFFQKMSPGACLAGCAKGFYMFTIISFIINWFGATGRIGNILLNFR